MNNKIGAFVFIAFICYIGFSGAVTGKEFSDFLKEDLKNYFENKDSVLNEEELLEASAFYLEHGENESFVISEEVLSDYSFSDTINENKRENCLAKNYQWCVSGKGVGSHLLGGLLDEDGYECWAECFEEIKKEEGVDILTPFE